MYTRTKKILISGYDIKKLWSFFNVKMYHQHHPIDSIIISCKYLYISIQFFYCIFILFYFFQCGSQWQKSVFSQALPFNFLLCFVLFIFILVFSQRWKRMRTYVFFFLFPCVLAVFFVMFRSDPFFPLRVFLFSYVLLLFNVLWVPCAYVYAVHTYLHCFCIQYSFFSGLCKIFSLFIIWWCEWVPRGSGLVSCILLNKKPLKLLRNIIKNDNNKPPLQFIFFAIITKFLW